MIKLTKREELIGSLVAKGMSDREISEALGIALPTVKLHVYSARKKFGVSNRTKLALKYLEDRDLITFSKAE